jgi:hypothetical protein
MTNIPSQRTPAEFLGEALKAMDRTPRTSVQTVEIVCPPWCRIAPEEHARELWNNEGNGLHLSDDVLIEDPSGYQEPLAEPRFHSPVRLALYSHTRPDNVESASPTLYIDDREYSVDQALAVAGAVRDMVDAYRSAGGVA